MRTTNFFVSVSGRIWALWGLCLFICTMLVAALFYAFCFAMKEPYRARWHRHVSRVWMSVYLFGIGCPLKIRGKENFKKGQNYIIVCNHSSFMDVPVTTPFMPNANKTIAKKEIASVPVFGWIYKLGAILIDRNNEQSRKQGYVKMKQVLKTGMDIVIYPEGTRNKTSEPLKPFFDGAFRLSSDTGIPIIPTLIFNTKKILPANRIFFMLPHLIEMHFLAPQLPDNMPVPIFKEKVFETMKRYHIANNVWNK